jgi:ferredoxin-NADP reductase/predicted pyridoxine 5'-phosphate oxidase superfamily flavin-nucleotide-binding protein
MHKIQDISELEGLVGKPPALVMMKQIPKLDEGCIQLLAHSSIAGFGYVTESGMHYTTIVGGLPGFVNVESPIRISFEVPISLAAPEKGSGASFVFLLPGVGEVLRLNGKVSDFVAGRITIAVEEAFIHCARAILRSQLWSVPSAELLPDEQDDRTVDMESLGTKRIVSFIEASPFILLSSWDAKGVSDTSPRGDAMGFLRLLDGQTLAMPDRQGNQRTDTFHNIIGNKRVSLVALIPGCSKLLHLSGNASITNDKDLLDSMSLNGKPPQAALLLEVTTVSITHSEALAQAQPWLASSHVDSQHVPDMMALALHHLSLNESAGRTGRFLGRLLSGSPKLVRTLMNLGYKSQLKNEGYATLKTEKPSPVKQGIVVRLVRGLSPNVRKKILNFLYRCSAYINRTAQSIEGDAPELPVEQSTLLTREVKVVAVNRETPAAVTLTVADLKGDQFEFKPGQFFTLFMNINGKQVIRSYSASNAPGTNQLSMTVKRVADGVCSNYVNQYLKPGDNLALRGPSGTFYVVPDPAASRAFVLIASGSGITPMMSIAQTVLATEAKSTITVLYGNRRWEDVIFAQAWADLCDTYPDRLVVKHILSAPHTGWTGGIGRLDESSTRRELETLAPSSNAHFYVCGPEPMMDGVTAALSSLEISIDRIHTERFGQVKPPAISKEMQPQISQVLTVTKKGEPSKETTVAVGQTLLQASLNAKLTVPFSCGMGNCGECRVKLVAGQVTMSEPNCLTDNDRNLGYILTCVARPLTPVKIELDE